MPLILLHVTEPEWTLALKIPRYYVSLQTKGSVRCKWAEYTAAGGEIQVGEMRIFDQGGLNGHRLFLAT